MQQLARSIGAVVPFAHARAAFRVMKRVRRNLARALLTAIYEYAIRRALWPMVLAGVCSLVLTWLGAPLRNEWMMRIGSSIAWIVCLWGTASMWYLLIFGRWIDL